MHGSSDSACAQALLAEFRQHVCVSCTVWIDVMPSCKVSVVHDAAKSTIGAIPC